MENESESLSRFNTFGAEIRDRIESLVKQVLVVSGGIQTITISAFLAANRPQLTIETVHLLQCSWYYLSASIVLCLFYLLYQILLLTQVGLKFKRKIEQPQAGHEILTAWFPLRVVAWLLGLSAFVTCIIGVIKISLAAISFIEV